MNGLRIALAQINCTVGDLPGNFQTIASVVAEARRRQADLVAFPELAVTGYPPEDLLLKSAFVADNLKMLDRIAALAEGITVLVGFVDRDEAGIYNAAALLHGGARRLVYHKIRLPNYGVFDEARYFLPGGAAPVFVINGVAGGVTICEDIWHAGGPAEAQAKAGAGVIININASP